jgi:hypothetical protein
VVARHFVTRALALSGLLGAGCLVGNLDVNPALDAVAGSGAAQSSGGKSSNAGDTTDAGDGPQTSGSPGDPGRAGGAGGSVEPGAAGLSGEGGTPSSSSCGYDEKSNVGNEHALPDQTGVAETTAQSSGGFVDICGQIDSDHFDAEREIVDIDSYEVDIATAGRIMTTVEFGREVPATSIELVVATADNAEQRVAASTSGGVWSALLPKGAVTISIVVSHPSALATAIPYVIRMKPDDVSLRCPELTSPDMADAAYAEKADGAQNQGNDAVRMSLDSKVPASMLGFSTAEDPDFWLREGQSALIQGSVGLSDLPDAGGYEDGDAYVLSVGATDQLTIRASWPAMNADLDLWVVPANSTKVWARATKLATTGGEALTFATNANTTYWLWVAGATSSISGLPKPYDITICGAPLGQ